MGKKTETYVDTSALIAFVDRSDSHHLLFRRLFSEPPDLLTTTLVVAEGHGWFLKRYDRTPGWTSCERGLSDQINSTDALQNAGGRFLRKDECFRESEPACSVLRRSLLGDVDEAPCVRAVKFCATTDWPWPN